MDVKFRERDPERTSMEVESMLSNTNADLVEAEDGRWYWREVLRGISGAQYTVVIDYPDRFPHEPPAAYVVEPQITDAPHRLANGQLCLWGDAWTASGMKTSALSVRSRVCTWLVAFELWQATGEWIAPAH